MVIVMFVIEIYLIFSMLAVIWFDLTRYIIPNWLSASLLLLYPLGVYMAQHSVDWKMAIVGMLIVLVVGYGIFVMKWMGGGDIKLLTVCSLWVGLHNLLEYLFYVTLLGGGMSVGILVLRKVIPFVPQLVGRKMPRILQDGAPVPYGVVIAGGFLIMIWTGEIPVIH